MSNNKTVKSLKKEELPNMIFLFNNYYLHLKRISQ